MADEIVGIVFSFTTFMILGSMYLRNRHRERLALIQYGRHELPQAKERKNSTLKFGLLLLSVGAGLLVGGLLDNIFDSEPQCTFACIFMLSGLSLLYYHNYLSDRESRPTSRVNKNAFMEEEDDILI